MRTALDSSSSKPSTNLAHGGDNLTVSAQEFWKQSNKDIAQLGYEGKSYKSNKIVPIGSGTSSSDNISRAGTSMERYNYDKEKGRDPKGIVAALGHKKLHSLRDEINDSNFSYFCSTQDKILDNSNSHPSFRIYFSFMKRFMIVLAICCLLSSCLVVYNSTSDWYQGKDTKWNLDYASLGNIDGLEYQAEGSFLASRQKDNADKGFALTFSIDMLATILMILFFVYQIDVSRVELHSKKSLYSITDYSVRVTSLPKKSPNNLEREIRNQFIRFGKILEVVSLRNYSKALRYELEIQKISDKIQDLKSIDQIKGTSSQKKIDSLVAKQQRLSVKKDNTSADPASTGHTKEYIVVFESTKSKKECIEAYRGYSHWWSRPNSKMPEDMRLQQSYGFKVKDAPEPSEYILENRARHRIWKLLVFIMAILIASVVCLFVINFRVHDVDDKFDVIPLYTRCSKYDFSLVTTSTYTTTTATVQQDEIYCYCRSKGKSTVEKDTGDLNSLCKNWLDSFDEYYHSFAKLIFSMLFLNVFITYFFKVVFQSKIFCVRNKTNRFLCTSICVLVFQFVFLGALPEYWMDQTIHDQGREWYLRAGPIYAYYFAWSLLLYPLETGVYLLVSFIYKKWRSKRAVLQKQLDNAIVGREYDYSHKLGRILAHAYIAFYHGSGLPILYVFLFIQVGIFILTEKFLLLKFYKKFNHIEPYVRQFIIHTILAMLFVHMFRAIAILGSQEIFPDKVKETLGLKNGTLLFFYTADDKSYSGRLALPAGIAYLIISLMLTVLYSLIWWSHRQNFIGKLFSWCALLDKPGLRAAKLSSIKPKNLVFYPNTYQFQDIYKYREVLPQIEKRYVVSEDIECRLEVPGMNKSGNLDSHYELKNSRKSDEEGDSRPADVAIKSSNVFNIYSQKNSSPK